MWKPALAVLRHATGTLLLLLVAHSAQAQRQAGSISGKVAEAEGGSLRGVTVTLAGDTGSVTATTDASGMFVFPAVDPGTYEVKAELGGFEGQTRPNVVVSIARQITLDFALKLPGAAETVEVVAQAPPVDMTSSFTDNTLSQDLLFRVPLRRSAEELLDYAPGVNNGSAFGGEARAANALLLDGVDTRDPEAGAAWIFLNYNWLEEVQIGGIGAPAEYGSYAGAIVNSVTRSGGNRYSGLFETLYTGPGLSSNNTTGLAGQNPALSDFATTRKLLDISAQLGGPLVPDRLFFFAGAQRVEQRLDPSGPRTSEKQVVPRLFFKLNYKPSASDQFVATLEADDVNRTGLDAIPSARAARSQATRNDSITDDLTLSQSAPSVVWSGQWRHSLGARTFGELKYTGWSGYYDVVPRVFEPAHFDLSTQQLKVSQGRFYYADRGRHQLNISVSRYAEAFGHHDLKFGLDVERSRVRSQFGLVDGLYYFDRDGSPVVATSYGYDVSAHNDRDSVYVQDSFRAGGRLTLNPGLRVDFIRGTNGELGTFYRSQPVQPRLGLAWDVTGSRRWLLKAHYGRYAETPLTYTWIDALPGFKDTVEFDVSSGRLSETSREPAVPARIDERIRHPSLEEGTLGLERALTPDLRVSLTGILRRNRGLIGSVRPGARFSPVDFTNPLTDEDMTVYALESPGEGFLVTNPRGYRYLDLDGRLIGTANPFRDYRGLMLVAHQRLAAAWQLQGSYVLSKATGTVDNTQFSSIPTQSFGSPNGALVNSEGELTNSRRHEIKLLASHHGSELALDVYFRSLSGRHYTPVNLVFVETRGSRALPRENVLDLRVERFFRLGAAKQDRLGFFVDVTNVFNSDAVIDVETLAASSDLPLGAPTGVIAPRQVTLGARWSF